MLALGNWAFLLFDVKEFWRVSCSVMSAWTRIETRSSKRGAVVAVIGCSVMSAWTRIETKRSASRAFFPLCCSVMSAWTRIETPSNSPAIFCPMLQLDVRMDADERGALACQGEEVVAAHAECGVGADMGFRADAQERCEIGRGLRQHQRAEDAAHRSFTPLGL